MSNMFDGATSFNGNISNWDVGNVTNMSNMFGNVTFFTNMTGKIDAHGTPYNYFISQRNATISVTIGAYYISDSILWIYAYRLSGGFNAIYNALHISSMDQLVGYSFRSSVDSTSRDILEMITLSEGYYAYYRVSGGGSGYIAHEDTGQEYTLYFTRTP
jgi:surface protein